MSPPLRVVTVRIEVPRGSFVKRTPDGAVDFRSPLPSLFNYGSILGTRARDGDPEDAVVLGPRLEAGAVVTLPVRGAVAFLDAGVPDEKAICARGPLSLIDRAKVRAFFRLYATAKACLNRARGLSGRTVYGGLRIFAGPRVVGSRDVP